MDSTRKPGADTGAAAQAPDLQRNYGKLGIAAVVAAMIPSGQASRGGAAHQTERSVQAPRRTARQSPQDTGR